MGLIVFSAVPYLASPLTLNHDWLIENLHRLHVGLIRDLGTAIGDAAAAAAKRLKNIKDSKSRIIILLTDGDNNKGEIDPVPAAQLAAALGEKVYTDRHRHRTAVLPAVVRTDHRQAQARRERQRHQHDHPAARQLRSAGQNGRTLQREVLSRHQPPRTQSIYDDIDRLEKTEVKLRRFTTYRPLFQWPLLAAFGLLSLEMVLANTRFRRVP